MVWVLHVWHVCACGGSVNALCDVHLSAPSVCVFLSVCVYVCVNMCFYLGGDEISPRG